MELTIVLLSIACCALLCRMLTRECPDELSEEAAALLRARSGRRDINDAALAVLTHENMLDMRLRDMVTRVEVAQEDLHRRDQAYLEHITKVRECLGDVRSEDDVYERLQAAGHMRTLCKLALSHSRLDDTELVLDLIEERAEQLAGMETRNAELFRENVALQQREAALRDELADADVQLRTFFWPHGEAEVMETRQQVTRLHRACAGIIAAAFSHLVHNDTDTFMLLREEANKLEDLKP